MTIRQKVFPDYWAIAADCSVQLIFEKISGAVKRPVCAEDIRVSENPNETGSIFVGFDLERYVVSPSREVHADTLRRVGS